MTINLYSNEIFYGRLSEIDTLPKGLQKVDHLKPSFINEDGDFCKADILLFKETEDSYIRVSKTKIFNEFGPTKIQHIERITIKDPWKEGMEW